MVDTFPAAMAFGQRLFGVEFSGTFIDIGVADEYHSGTAHRIGTHAL